MDGRKDPAMDAARGDRDRGGAGVVFSDLQLFPGGGQAVPTAAAAAASAAGKVGGMRVTVKVHKRGSADPSKGRYSAHVMARHVAGDDLISGTREPNYEKARELARASLSALMPGEPLEIEWQVQPYIPTVAARRKRAGAGVAAAEPGGDRGEGSGNAAA